PAHGHTLSNRVAEAAARLYLIPRLEGSGEIEQTGRLPHDFLETIRPRVGVSCRGLGLHLRLGDVLLNVRHHLLLCRTLRGSHIISLPIRSGNAIFGHHSTFWIDQPPW